VDALSVDGPAWKAINFARWFVSMRIQFVQTPPRWFGPRRFVDWFTPSVHLHHDAEETIFFPWIKSKV
jgi:hypothetical protein